MSELSAAPLVVRMADAMRERFAATGGVTPEDLAGAFSAEEIAAHGEAAAALARKGFVRQAGAPGPSPALAGLIAEVDAIGRFTGHVARKVKTLDAGLRRLSQESAALAPHAGGLS
ncbi:hypothetical protein [Afifella sp. IM 167]|uniref:hypothetical protein n=1 Tax=Afifella sp. IM 167 TaxID=2033586 RepID=UPI001CCD5733|nr:hypothetical protein [Afifella sp. IM 167]MBZ8133264.1 hypothetical protein [Afifella sp. IM 167]